MARVAIFGFDGLGVGEYASPEYIERTIGANTGNLLFWSAVKSLFRDEYEYLAKVGRPFPPYEYVNQTFDVLIKPAANHLDPKILHPQLVEYLEKLDVPILVLGLGSQLSSLDDFEDAKTAFASAPHCVRFIDVLNDKCPTVCVRGDTSAQLLHELGYRGVIEIAGCPSQTLSMEEGLAKTIADGLGALSQKLRNGQPIRVQHLLPSQWDSHLTWTVQRVRELFASDELIEVQQSGGVENFSRYFDRHGLNTESPMTSRNGDRGDPVMFFNLESWASAIRDIDFSIGTRVHGNILATQLGVPCLVVSHDIRLNELCAQQALPSVDVDEFKEIEGRSAVAEHIRYEADRFERMRVENLSKFRRAIEAVGLTPSEKLMRLTASVA